LIRLRDRRADPLDHGALEIAADAGRDFEEDDGLCRFGVEAPVLAHVFERPFAQEDPSVRHAVGLIEGGVDLFYQPLLRIDANAWSDVDICDRHGGLLSGLITRQFGILWFDRQIGWLVDDYSASEVGNRPGHRTRSIRRHEGRYIRE